MKIDLFENEAVPDGGVDAGAAPEPGEAPGVVEPDGTEAPVAEAEATPAWAPSQDDWATLTQTVQQLATAAAPAPAVQAVPQLADYADADGAISPEALQKYVDEQITRGVNAQLEPVKPVLDQTIMERGEQMINQRFDELKSSVGDFDAALARQVAEGFAARPGVDPSHATEQAAKLVRDVVQRERAAAVEEYKQTLANVGNAPREPGAAGAGVERIEPRSGPDGYRDVTENFLARRNVA